jgi:hypothetical protein
MAKPIMLTPSSEPVLADRLKDWEALAKRFDLEPSPESQALLRSILDLDQDTAVAPIYRNELKLLSDRRIRLYLFDYLDLKKRSIGRPEQLVSVCMLSAQEPFSQLSLKVVRKPHKVLETLEASKSGSTVLDFPDDPNFSEKITIYTREPEAARRLFNQAIRERLIHAFYERDVSPILLLGEKRLLFSSATPAKQPTSLVSLDRLIGDLLSLFALLSAVS